MITLPQVSKGNEFVSPMRCNGVYWPTGWSKSSSRPRFQQLHCWDTNGTSEAQLLRSLLSKRRRMDSISAPKVLLRHQDWGGLQFVAICSFSPCVLFSQHAPSLPEPLAAEPAEGNQWISVLARLLHSKSVAPKLIPPLCI
eukprot:s5099_g1.t1